LLSQVALCGGGQRNHILTFESWLNEQQYREDTIGALARIPSMQQVEHKGSPRKPDEHKIWTDIVIRISELGYVEAFNEAWQEFQVAKQKA
jgi:hypothetical protein